MKTGYFSPIQISFLLLLASIASAVGIFSGGGSGIYEYISIRGEQVDIYGAGIYRDMSAEVAIQGIAQDFITLFVAIPLLLFSLFLSRKGSVKWRLVFAGVLAYFFVTYLFYLLMAMYNNLFLVYTSLLGLSFFSLLKVLFSFEPGFITFKPKSSTSLKFAGRFLMLNAACIGILWLSIILIPILNGRVYPEGLAHYTTLVVQGLDLGLLLPLSFISGHLLIKQKPLGNLAAPVYLVFLSLLMLALVAKIVFSGIAGYNIVPVVFIIPVITFVSIISSVMLIKKVVEPVKQPI